MPRNHELFLVTLRFILPSVNLFDLSLQLNGFPVKRAHRLLETIQNKAENDFEGYVDEQKRTIFQHHLQNTNFYRNLVHNSNVNNWSTIPIVTKRNLQQPLEKRLSKGYSKRNVYVNKTSGSSGDPFIFAKDKFCHALTWAVIQDRFSWFDLDLNTSKQARFYGIPLDPVGNYKERFKDVLSNRYRFSVFDLSDRALKMALDVFGKIPFEYINGYTSAIVQFAKFLRLKTINLKEICPSLKACVVTSEMLFETDKILMEDQFGVPVINEYGASELDLIAFENPAGEWQINSETLYVEILDANDQVLPNGSEGRIVITSLYNKAHPFIRYDIGDIGILSENSTTKKPILKKLTGRTNDIAVLPSGKKAAGLTFYYITKSIIEDDGAIKEFVIEQHEQDLFKIIYVSKESLSNEKRHNITAEMERYLEKGLKIQFERQDRLIRTKSGKLKQFSSLLNLET